MPGSICRRVVVLWRVCKVEAGNRVERVAGWCGCCGVRAVRCARGASAAALSTR